jgi:hypothetical protein
MRNQEHEMQTGSKWMSFRPMILGVFSIGIGTKIAESFLNPKSAYCGEAPDPTVAYIFSAALIVFGLWQLWQSFAHSLAWTKDTLAVRNRLGKTTYVNFADLTNIEYYGNSTIYVFGDVSVRVFDWVSAREDLDEEFMDVIRTYAPHLGYIAAFRGALVEAETAGCLRCNCLCAPSDVINWAVEEGDEEDDLDLGACPTCETTEGLMFGVNGNVITKAGLKKWNELLLETLNDDEKANRLTEIKEGLTIARAKGAFSLS